MSRIMNDTVSPMAFVDFPDDVQLCVLSFLEPSDVSAFASASRRCVSLCRRTDNRLWFAMCDRRWGSDTRISKWGGGKIPYRLLYRTLSCWDGLIGFWRRGGIDDDYDDEDAAIPAPPLVLFEWGSHFVSGSRVSPSTNGTYGVVKSPFLRLSLSPKGETVNSLDPDGRSEPANWLESSELIPATVNFIGMTHLLVEEDLSFGGIRRSSSSKSFRSGEDEEEDGVSSDFGSPGSLPDRFVAEVYQQVANRTSPVGERAARRQRRREKERRARRRRLDPQHFVKIVNCSPTPSRPFQGLWKGIYDDMKLGFYLIVYDDVGSITCRKIWHSSKDNNSSHGPLFWISDTSFVEWPVPAEEQTLYEARTHLRPIPEVDCLLDGLSLAESAAVSRVLRIHCSSLDLTNLYLTFANTELVEGRIWQYGDGSFGFGFLQDNVIVDLKPVLGNGLLLDSVVFPAD